jgi:hypothetical protein
MRFLSNTLTGQASIATPPSNSACSRLAGEQASLVSCLGEPLKRWMLCDMNVVRHTAIVTLLLATVSFSACSSKHPSDETLLKEFQTHKAEFNQLLQMFLSDKRLGRVAYNFTRPENPSEIGISQQRLQEYRELFDELNLSAGIEGYDEKDVVWFHASSQGLSVTGSSKGFAYITKPPQLIVGSLDGFRSRDGRSFTAFRHIEGNWYLYFDYED